MPPLHRRMEQLREIAFCAFDSSTNSSAEEIERSEECQNWIHTSLYEEIIVFLFHFHAIQSSSPSPPIVFGRPSSIYRFDYSKYRILWWEARMNQWTRRGDDDTFDWHLSLLFTCWRCFCLLKGVNMCVCVIQCLSQMGGSPNGVWIACCLFSAGSGWGEEQRSDCHTTNLIDSIDTLSGIVLWNSL